MTTIKVPFYERRTGAVGFTPLPNVDPKAVMADASGLAKGMAQAGATLDAWAEAKAQVRDQTEVAKAKTELSVALSEAELAAAKDPDYATMPDRFAAGATALRDKLAAGISSQRAREAFAIEADHYVGLAGVNIRKKAWQQEVDAGRASVTTLLQGLQNQAVDAGSPQQRAFVMQQAHDELARAEKSQLFSAQEVTALKARHDEGVDSVLVQRLIDKNPSAAARALSTTAAFPGLSAEHRQAYASRAQNEIERRNREAVADQRATLVALSHQADSQLSRLDAGYPADLAGIRDGVAKLAKSGDAATRETATRLLATVTEHEKTAAVVDELARLPLPEQRVRLAELDQTARADRGTASVARVHLATKVLDATTREVVKDPIAQAQRARLLDIPPIDWADPASIARRATDARKLAVVQGVSQVPPLSQGEAEALSTAIAQADRAGKADWASRILQGFGRDGAKAVFGLVKTDHPSFAQAGALVAEGDRKGADDILRGAELRATVAAPGSPGRQYMPPKDDLFRTYLTEALPPDALGSFKTGEDQRRVQEAILDVYAAKSQAAGHANQTVVNQNTLAQAVTTVTGGVVTFNRGKVIAPVRGMDQDAFDDLMKGLTQEDIAGARSLDGHAVRIDDLRAHGRLEFLSEGRYLVKFGDGFAAGPDSQPYVLDLRRKAQSAHDGGTG